MQQAMCMRLVLLSSVTCLAQQYYLTNCKIFGKIYWT